jgi:archaellum biogenesis ATPase FlaH
MMESRSSANRVALLPEQLNNNLDGGLLKGHHVVVFGPTEIGKSLFLLNAVRGFMEQGLTTLFVLNEEPADDLIERFLTGVLQKDKHTIRKNHVKAQAAAMAKGWDKVIWAELSPGTLGEVRGLVEKYKPDVLIVDQIRNLDAGEPNFVRTLEKCAQAMRNFAKKYKLVAISVTQAADSATGKTILGRGDIDSSNIGIPGTADLMLGIGCSLSEEYTGIRTFSFPKNKVSGQKSPVNALFNMATQRIE